MQVLKGIQDPSQEPVHFLKVLTPAFATEL